MGEPNFNRIKMQMQAQQQAAAQNAQANDAAAGKRRQSDIAAQQAGRIKSATYAQRNTKYENQAGVTAPVYEGTRDRAGRLLKQYQFDPYGGDALQALKGQAFAQGESPWAAMQNQQLTAQTQDAQDEAQKQQMQAQSQAQAQLARFGGLGGGARTSLARSGAKDQMLAQQGIARNALNQRLGIGAQDIDRKQGLLQNFADSEQKGQEFNIGQRSADINRRSLFDANRYNQQMAAWGAKQTAQAQRQAAGGGKK